MEALPEDVALALLRGVGAYLRGASVSDLPPHLRRFKGFRAAALARQREQILALLDDEAQRALVLQWLDEDKPPLSKPDADLLRLAAERPEGWAEQLRSRSTQDDGAPPESSTDKGSASRERERERAKRARDELRRYKQDSETAFRAEKAKTEAARQEVHDLRSRAESLEKELQAAQSEVAKERARADREVRRARSDAERAQAKADETATAMRELRKDLEAARSRVEELERPDKPARKSAPARTTAPSEPRKPLKVPKGRFEDDPETLEAWLDSDDVLLLIDGYNVTKAEGGFGDLELPRQRDLLIQNVNRLARARKVTGTIVFDGNEVPPGTKKVGRGPVKATYSAPDEIADDHIVALLEGLPPVPVVLVTNDRELQERGRALGATIATSNQLLKLIH